MKNFRYLPQMKGSSSHPKKGGQILVLMALLSTTLVILFGMVVGMGHLIQAKMNLQNAADLAAMSGASLQARYMNQLSLVNYRLRQNYKFQLYDFYVTASRFNRGLRQSVAVQGGNILERLDRNETSFGICQQSFGFNPNFSDGVTSSSGSPTASDTDFCRNVWGSGTYGQRIPPIIPSPVPNLNPILIAANLAVMNLSNRLRSLCSSNSGTNRQYFEIMTRALDKRQHHQVIQMIKIIAQFDQAFGTGDELDVNRPGDQTMLRTLQDNFISANKGANMKVRWLNPNQTRAFRVGDTNQLETRIFDHGSAGGSFSDYFERQRVRFTFPYVDFGNNCAVRVLPASSNYETIIGLARTRVGGTGAVVVPISTAIEVTITPNLLFWPRGLTPTLVAVGGAKAFGSRIGPPLELTNLEISGFSTLPGLALMGNMSFYPGDYTDSTALHGPMSGIGHKTILRHLLNSLFQPGNGNNSGINRRRPSASATGWDPPGDCSGSGGRLPFLCMALAPTLYEGLFYNAYQFPTSRIASPLIKAAFPGLSPGDYFPSVAKSPDYNLADRQTGDLTPQEAAAWHATTYIGGTPDFRISGNPVFFADTISSMSSWSPDYKSDLSNLDPSKGESRPGSRGQTNPASRQGYSIKLVRLQEICDSMDEGQKIRPSGPLKDYCTPQGLQQVFH